MSVGKRLSELLVGIAGVAPASDRAITGLTLDSRKVHPGDLFVALPGLQQDGRGFIADAIARGAAAVVYDSDGYDPGPLAVPTVGTAKLASRASAIADRFYDAPSRDLLVIGVTGTNGKTTCTQLLAQALDHEGETVHATGAAGHPACGRCAVIGTLGYGFPNAIDPGLHTTPDAITTQRVLAEALAAGATYAAMEVSSHALEQGRVDAVVFAVAVFTNLSRDHLDYHGDMERYAAAKSQLFTRDGLNAAIINCDDAYGRRLINALGGRTRVVTYGLSSGDISARSLDCAHDGLRLRARTPHGEVDIAAPLLGRFNASNLLAVLATLLALGFEPDAAVRRLSRLRPVPGRVERFKVSDDRPLVVIDYAHTPDALEQVLQALRPHVAGQLWCVFGCGGDRDRGKRPQMGAIAERLADRVILTDDNPRHESGDAIIRDIAAGMHAPPRVLRDRKSAIAAALSEAAAGDIILVAGKGHEDYQLVGDTRHPYSDRDTVRGLLGLAA
jgi:UDP-N-acetylmuramoyl-L-alanyl-D-glutamate--2,6-diaminopimelate ligase